MGHRNQKIQCIKCTQSAKDLYRKNIYRLNFGLCLLVFGIISNYYKPITLKICMNIYFYSLIWMSVFGLYFFLIDCSFFYIPHIVCYVLKWYGGMWRILFWGNNKFLWLCTKGFIHPSGAWSLSGSIMAFPLI